MKKVRKVGTGLLLAVVVSAALIGAARNTDIYFLIKKNFTIFSEVYREVSLHYVDAVDPEKLMRKGINAMLESLDPYTVFIDEAQNQDIEIITRGSYGGIGIEVGYKGDEIVVIAPMEGYPAYDKGIRSGDIIKAVNGISVDELSPEEVQDMTVGEVGTPVSLTVRRYGVDQDLSFTFNRQRIEVKNIAYQGLVGPDKDVGYILLSRFAQNAGDEVRSAIESLQSQAKLKGLVLDLRNNPGGLLGEAVKTVDKFVKPGQLVVETRGRLSEQNEEFRTNEPAMLPTLPLVVLQNGGSASASEIVAGALQDMDRAVIMGEQSFGKGLVQIIRPLSYNTVLKITVSRYYIPSGRSIQSVTYTHDGHNVGRQKPDSLRKAFKTANGRTVYDGEGIAPDIDIPASQPTLLETALFQHSIFFHFANRFASQHKQYNEPAVSDAVFAEFKKFIKEQDFSYKTRAEQQLVDVKSSLKPQVEKKIDKHIAAIEQTIDKQKEQAFTDQTNDLKRILYLELISRYKGTEGQTAVSLQFDPLVHRAAGLLKDPKQYRKILGGD